MKIAYLLHWNGSFESGVWKKVEQQVKSWSRYGARVRVFLVGREGTLSAPNKRLGEGVYVFGYSSLPSRINAWMRATNLIEGFSPDLIYFRYGLYLPMLEPLFKRYPTIIEVNTNDLKEFCLKPGLRCWYNQLTRERLLYLAKGFVAVSYELGNLFAKYAKPLTVIGNGIDLDLYPTLLPPHNLSPRLVFLGTPGQPWHGVDKIMEMASFFPEWDFDVVGPSPGPSFPQNVTVHGFLPSCDYVPLLERADVAIGTLALHRNDMNEASPLKVREYLACGLPVIIGYLDTDFLNGAEFILQIPNTEDNVRRSADLIKDFVIRWSGRRVDRGWIAHLDVKYKEQKRLRFFEEVIGR